MSAKPFRRMMAAPRRPMGFSLVELMISLILGLLVVAGASGVFLANRRAYANTETLGRMQETARVAFELMARDIREAGGNPCGKNVPVANVLNNKATDWWAGMGTGVLGGTGAPSVAGSDWLQLSSATTGVEYITRTPGQNDTKNDKDKGNNQSAPIFMAKGKTDMKDGDIVLACDDTQAAVFQITNLNLNGSQIVAVHNTGTGTPGNCSKRLGFPTGNPCSNSTGNAHDFTGGALARMTGVRWFIRDSGRGNSLYRCTADGCDTGKLDEIAEGVQKMTLEYLVAGQTAYQTAAAVTAAGTWSRVTAIRVTLDVEARAGSDKGANISGTDTEAGKLKVLTRSITHVVTLRNRMG
ncbi:PilW family protein [Lysobacter xanthus]